MVVSGSIGNLEEIGTIKNCRTLSNGASGKLVKHFSSLHLKFDENINLFYSIEDNFIVIGLKFVSSASLVLFEKLILQSIDKHLGKLKRLFSITIKIFAESIFQDLR